jgi:hypothetical protein
LNFIAVNKMSYISSIRKQLNEEPSEEEPRMTEDSFLKRDLDKLKTLWRNVKEVKQAIKFPLVLE